MVKDKDKHSVILRVESLAHQGDGVLRENKHTYYISHVLPAEEVEVNLTEKGRGILKKVLTPSPQRRKAPCPYYDKCGGCVMQHANQEFYRTWKVEKLKSDLSRFNISPEKWGESVFISEGTRRRVVLKVKKRKGKVEVGFFARKSHDFTSINKCLLLTPLLNKLIPSLPKGLLYLMKDNLSEVEVKLTETLSGIDMLVNIPQKRELSYDERENLAIWAKENNLARLVLRWPDFTDVVSVFSTPVVEFDGIRVPISSNGFLQASDSSDKVLFELVNEAISGLQGRKIADLFCGRGTFTLPLAKNNTVCGFEMDEESLQVLQMVARENKLPVKTERRQLFENPLTTEECNAFAAVVLDPPRSGAQAQCKNLALSKVEVVVYVSCNPDTFARDAIELAQGGYILDKLTLVDQFVYSSHTEVVGIFIKK